MIRRGRSFLALMIQKTPSPSVFHYREPSHGIGRGIQGRCISCKSWNTNTLQCVNVYGLWQADLLQFCVKRALRECPPASVLSERSELKRRAVTGIREASRKTNMSCGHNHRQCAYEKAAFHDYMKSLPWGVD